MFSHFIKTLLLFYNVSGGCLNFRGGGPPLLEHAAGNSALHQICMKMQDSASELCLSFGVLQKSPGQRRASALAAAWDTQPGGSLTHTQTLFMGYFQSFLHPFCFVFLFSCPSLSLFFLLLFWYHWCFYIPFLPFFSVFLIVKSLMRPLWTRGRTFAFTSAHRRRSPTSPPDPSRASLPLSLPFSTNLSSISSHLTSFAFPHFLLSVFLLSLLPRYFLHRSLWSRRPPCWSPSRSAAGLLTRVAAEKFPFSPPVSCNIDTSRPDSLALQSVTSLTHPWKGKMTSSRSFLLSRFVCVSVCAHICSFLLNVYVWAHLSCELSDTLRCILTMCLQLRQPKVPLCQTVAGRTHLKMCVKL